MADFTRFAARKGAQEREDKQALRELEARRVELAPGLSLQWLGVSGYRMSYEGQTLLVDPYISRVPLGAVLRRQPALPDPLLIERYFGDLDQVVGVLVGHTHFDHAVDAPAIAQRFDCPVYGSTSLVALMQAHGLQELAVEVEPHVTYELGPFTVSFTPSLHSKLILGLAVPFDGALSCEQLDALTPSAYKCGRVYGIRIEVAGISFYHQGSANLIDEEIRASERGVDFFLAGVAGRGFTKDYWRRILKRLEPRTIIPTHYDDFFRPLDRPAGFTTNVHLSRVPYEVAKVSRDFEVAALPLLGKQIGRASCR
ncbi:MAG: MBL fold metallo-hydrolase, partial [Solirubrobacterales bacterium]|nr:MBL fold metallo-hydrolase [Solirubrobacterales bacterium]